MQAHALLCTQVPKGEHWGELEIEEEESEEEESEEEEEQQDGAFPLHRRAKA